MFKASFGKRKHILPKLQQVFIILLGFFLIFIAKIDVFALKTTQQSAGKVFAPLLDIMSTPVRAIETMFEGVRTVASLREEAIRLRAENQRLKRYQRRAEILEGENRKLRSVLGAVVPLDRRAITARAISAPGSNFTHSILIKHGSKELIQRGDPVVTMNGLIGYVIEVGKEYSWVLLITDVNSKIPVVLSSSSWPGLAIGKNGKFLSLDFLPAEASPQEDELVVTSGHGDVLPSGLPVGRVRIGNGRNFNVLPVVDLRKISYVSILTRTIKSQKDNVKNLENFFNPIPQEKSGRLFEGFSPKEFFK